MDQLGLTPIRSKTCLFFYLFQDSIYCVQSLNHCLLCCCLLLRVHPLPHLLLPDPRPLFTFPALTEGYSTCLRNEVYE